MSLGSGRTEELGLSRLLPIQVGGEAKLLATLNLEQSERWQAMAMSAVAATVTEELVRDSEADEDGVAAVLAGLARVPSRLMLHLLREYDTAGGEREAVLPDEATLRRTLSQAELYAAVVEAWRAEVPFATDARSVVEAFGPQIQRVANVLVARFIAGLQLGSSTSGPLPTGRASARRTRSGGASAKNSS